MDHLTDRQSDFINRFIMKLPETGADTPPDGQETATRPLKPLAVEMRRIWDAQKGTADRQIGALQRVLREQNSAACQEVADKGLIGFTGGLQSALSRTLIEIENSTAEDAKDIIEDAIDVFDSFHAFLKGDDAVNMIEKNPFNVTVDLKGTLGKALTEMKSAAAAY